MPPVVIEAEHLVAVDPTDRPNLNMSANLDFSLLISY